MEIAFKIERIDDLDEISKLIEGEKTTHNNIVGAEISSYVMELCKLLNVKKINRIIYGSEFCQYRMPPIKKIKEMIQFCKEKNISFTLQTPRVDEAGIIIMEKLLDSLKEYEIEIEINDLGVLNYISKCNHKWSLAVGRLWDQSFHDGRLSTKEQHLFFGQSKRTFIPTIPLDSEDHNQIFRKYHLNIVNVDLTGTQIEGKQGYGLYFPYTYMTTGGICKMRCLSQSSKFSLEDNYCDMNCSRYDEIMSKSFIDMSSNNPEFSDGYTLRRVKMFKKGNTVFYIPGIIENSIDEFAKNILGFERIIFEIRLML